MKRIKNSYGEFKFSSGKTIEFREFTVGLDIAEDGILKRLREGCDGSLCNFSDDIDDDEALTKAECIELAEFMILEWKKYLNLLKKE